MAQSGEEGEAHGPADDQGVHPLKQGLYDPQLVAHLRSTEHGDKRAGRFLQHPVEHLDLAGHGPAGGRGQQPGRPDDRGVGPVGRPESVVYVGVLAFHQLLGEAQVAGLLARVEAKVLPNVHPPRLGARGGQELGQSVPNRAHLESRIGPALRPAQVADDSDPGRALVEQPGEGLQ